MLVIECDEHFVDELYYGVSELETKESFCANSL